MDINKQWQNLEDCKFSNIQIHENMIIQAIKQDSKSTISLLKARLRHKINWIVFFLILFSGMIMYHHNNMAIVSIMVFFIAVYFAFFFLLYKEYKKMGVSETFDLSATQCLSDNIFSIKSAIRKETLMGTITIPTIAIGGLLLSYLLEGQSLEFAIENSFTIRKLLFASISVLGGFLFAFYDNKDVLGTHIKALEKQLENLKLSE